MTNYHKTTQLNIKHWNEIREQAKIFSIESKENQKIQHDRNEKLREFAMGDNVMYQTLPGKTKFKRRFSGPHKVIKKQGKTTYQIVNSERNNKIQRVHGSQLKPYHKRRQLNAIIQLLLILSDQLIRSSEASLPDGPSLIWRKTNYRPKQRIQTYQISLGFANPCKEVKNSREVANDKQRVEI